MLDYHTFWRARGARSIEKVSHVAEVWLWKRQGTTRFIHFLWQPHTADAGKGQ